MNTSFYHLDWQVSRVNYILSRFDKDYFEGKRILELGAYNGFIGNCFKKVGAHVTCIEGRQSNADNIKADYPNLDVICANLDTDIWDYGHFDIIINFGLFYHLEKYHYQHLTNCIDNCDIMFFETVVIDSDKPILFFKSESLLKDDQSLSGCAGYPTTSYIENIFQDKNINFEKIISNELNGDNQIYDWEDKNSVIGDTFKVSLYHNSYSCNRRFWIVKK